jgi:signal transduction histidine kinase
MRSTIDLARPEAESARIELTLEPLQPGDASFEGDPRRVRQIVGNLLSNAIKFTPAGGQIAVTGGVADGEDGARRVFVTVEDTGPGIDSEDLERIFDPFVQLDSGYTRGRGGAGLGLPISRHLARLMGGDLAVRSEPGAGSSFTFWLPEARPGKGKPAEAAARAVGGRERRRR